MSRKRSGRDLMKLAAILGAVSILVATQARADDRPVTPEERTQLAAALQAQGCTGGKMEFDDAASSRSTTPNAATAAPTISISTRPSSC